MFLKKVFKDNQTKTKHVSIVSGSFETEKSGPKICDVHGEGHREKMSNLL